MSDLNFQIDSVLESVACNLCSATDFDVLHPSNYETFSSLEQLTKIYSSSSEDSLFDQIVRCVSCDLIYLNPRISGEVVKTGYTIAIDTRHHEQDYFREHSFRRALNGLNAYLKPLLGKLESPRLVDVGCAGGIFVKVANDFGFDAKGLELSQYLANFGTEKYNVQILPMTLEDFASENRNRDITLVSFWDVLEHLPDPSSTLKTVNSILDESGLLLLNLPMVDTFPAKLLSFKWPFYLNVHTYYFSIDTITRLLEKSGFKIIYHSRYWQTLGLGYVFQRAGIKSSWLQWMFRKVPFKYYMGQRTILAKKSPA